MEYIVFTDESSITASRYQSIAAFSFPFSQLDSIKKEIKGILSSSDVREFKWQRLGSAKYRFCALKIVDWIFQNLEAKALRLDVLTWDTHDSRHQINKRDDTKNYERMFFHLLNNSMARRKLEASWHIRPDQKTDIDWQTCHECLKSAGKWIIEIVESISDKKKEYRRFEINSLEEVNSVDEPCTQIADLFAGMSVFAIDNFPKYTEWIEYKYPSLFSQNQEPSFSNSERERLRVLDQLLMHCNRQKLSVSYNTNKRLNTYDPKKPINFWFYIPQHDQDKAPVAENKIDAVIKIGTA